MYCPECNTQVPEGQSYCPKCGNQIVRPATSTEATYKGPIGDDKKIMTLGIVALALSVFGIPGLIVGIMARKRSNGYIQMLNGLSPKARVGRILGTVAIGVGAFFIAYWAFWIVYLTVAVSVFAFLN